MSDYLPPVTRSVTRKLRAHLPPEIIAQILRRLPLKLVVKCTSVCKTWYALIKEPSFILSHLEVADDLLLVRFVVDLKDFYRLRRDNDAFEEFKKLRSPPFKCTELWTLHMVGTCNGLICLADLWQSPWNVILWNPSIHKHFTLPKFDLHPRGGNESTLGFGFDSVSHDYKVLLVVPKRDNSDLTEIWLFSLNRRSWMRFAEDSQKRIVRGSGVAVFVKGAFHWLAYLKNGTCLIFSLDINTEKYSMMNFPGTLAQFSPQLSLIKYEESIALVKPCEVFEDGKLELWVMSEYGVNSSWTKVLRSIDENGELVFDASLVNVFGVRKNGEVLLLVEGRGGEGVLGIHTN